MKEFEVEEILAEPNEEKSSLVDGLEMSHAWFIVAAAGLIYYIWVNKLSPMYYQWKSERTLRKINAKAKKDSNLEYHIEEARMSAVNRLQDEYNKLALKAQQLKSEREYKKKEESINRLSLEGGRKLNDNYYPLSGQNSRSYLVPAKRTGCQGGC